jgi:hypothetical protein
MDANSGICYLQNMQITRHATHEGEPYLLHVVRVMRVETLCQSHQERFPGPGWEEKQEQDWLRYCINLRTVCRASLFQSDFLLFHLALQLHWHCRAREKNAGKYFTKEHAFIRR